MTVSTAITVAAFPKNARETLRVMLNEYKGHYLVDVRAYVPLVSHSDALTATKVGISLNVSLLPALRAALAEAESQAAKLGWLEAAL